MFKNWSRTSLNDDAEYQIHWDKHADRYIILFYRKVLAWDYWSLRHCWRCWNAVQSRLAGWLKFAWERWIIPISIRGQSSRSMMIEILYDEEGLSTGWNGTVWLMSSSLQKRRFAKRFRPCRRNLRLIESNRSPGYRAPAGRIDTSWL